MKIGIIGAGNVGTGLGRRLAAHGHEIMVSFARTPDKVAAAAAAIGAGARAVTPAEAVAESELVVLATPWGVTLDVTRELAALLANRIIWDTTNPLKPDMSGLAVGTTSSGGEEVAKLTPGARVVKAIAPFAEVLQSPVDDLISAPPGVFVCGDDPAARAVVAGLVTAIGGDPVDAGPLTMARYAEPAAMLLVQLAYVQGFGPQIGLTVLRERPSQVLAA